MTSDVPGRPGSGSVSPAVAALRESLTAVVVATEALRSDVTAAETARRRTGRINLGLIGMLVGLVALLLAIGYQNNRLVRGQKRTNERIADCTTAGGTCYEQGRERSSGAIAAIVRISVYVTECGRLWPGESGPDFDRKLEKCVADRLAADVAKAQPGPSTSPHQ